MDLTTTSFETERLLVRACCMQDADALTELMTPEISQWVAIWPTPLTVQDTQDILRSNINAAQRGSVFAAVVMLKETSEIIGWCKLDIGDDQAELGYWIGEAYQRKGFAMELSRGAIGFAFDHFGTSSVRAGAQVANTASLALLAKLGMTREGVEPVWTPARQRHEQCEFWSLVAPKCPTG